ncbi:MAG: hypothetical protein EOP61_38210, partial [Sphingomonadales bacterium]
MLDAIKPIVEIDQLRVEFQTDGGTVVGVRELAVDLQAVGELALDGEDRVERGHRLLEDHADLVA